MRCRILKRLNMHSAIYHGSLRHRRYAPRPHGFSYPLFMVYLDLAELDTVFVLAVRGQKEAGAAAT